MTAKRGEVTAGREDVTIGWWEETKGDDGKVSDGVTNGLEVVTKGLGEVWKILGDVPNGEEVPELEVVPKLKGIPRVLDGVPDWLNDENEGREDVAKEFELVGLAVGR